MTDEISAKYHASIRRLMSAARDTNTGLLEMKLECGHVTTGSDSILAGWMFCMDCFKSEGPNLTTPHAMP